MYVSLDTDEDGTRVFSDNYYFHIQDCIDAFVPDQNVTEAERQTFVSRIDDVNNGFDCSQEMRVAGAIGLCGGLDSGFQTTLIVEYSGPVIQESEVSANIGIAGNSLGTLLNFTVDPNADGAFISSAGNVPAVGSTFNFNGVTRTVVNVITESGANEGQHINLSLIHISEPTRPY